MEVEVRLMRIFVFHFAVAVTLVTERRRSEAGLANIVPKKLREPQIAVWPRGDAFRGAASGGYRKLRDYSRGGDPPNLIPVFLCEPQIAVRPRRDYERPARAG